MVGETLKREDRQKWIIKDTVECGYAGHAAAGLQGANMILAKVNDQSVVVFEHRLTNIGMK